MAAQTFGEVEEFDPKREEWSQCEERLGFYFVANGVEDAIFLTLIGAQNLQVTVKPTSPGEKDLDCTAFSVQHQSQSSSMSPSSEL